MSYFYDMITDRDLSMLKEFSKGLVAKQVADVLGMNVCNIEKRMYRLKKFYKAQTTTHLVSMYLRKELYTN